MPPPSRRACRSCAPGRVRLRPVVERGFGSEPLVLLLDSSFLIDLLRGRANAKKLAEEIDASRESPHIPAPALYEVRAGLLHQGSRAQAARFTAMLRTFPIAPFDAPAAELPKCRRRRCGREMRGAMQTP